MAIRNRRGDYGNFEPNKMVAGEFAYVNSGDPNTADGQGVYATFSGGRVKRLCTFEEVSGLIAQAKAYRDETEVIKGQTEIIKEDTSAIKTQTEQIKNDTDTIKTETSLLKDGAEEFKELSRSYAVGTDGVVRTDDATDNAKYYKEWIEHEFDVTITKVGNVGLTDYYRIDYSNGKKVEFEVNNGEKGDTGEGFSVYKTYPSIADMEADAPNVPEGKFVLIASDVQDPDNAKLYVRNATDFTFLTDMSGSQGIKGEKGDKGDKGDTGDAGMLATETTAGVVKIPTDGTITIDPDGTIHSNGGGGSTSAEELTFEEYKAKENAGTLDPEILYIITDRDNIFSAEQIGFENTVSGLKSNNVQSAINELAKRKESEFETYFETVMFSSSTYTIITIPIPPNKKLGFIMCQAFADKVFETFSYGYTVEDGNINIKISPYQISVPTVYNPHTVSVIYKLIDE